MYCLISTLLHSSESKVMDFCPNKCYSAKHKYYIVKQCILNTYIKFKINMKNFSNAWMRTNIHVDSIMRRNTASFSTWKDRKLVKWGNKFSQINNMVLSEKQKSITFSSNGGLKHFLNNKDIQNLDTTIQKHF